jgi:mevalonate kinase
VKKRLYSNGKLLITGEYTVLNGAKSLALPTRFGQYLEVEPYMHGLVFWTSYDADGSVWYEDSFSFEDIIEPKNSNTRNHIKKALLEILHEASKINLDFLTSDKGYKIATRLTFPKDWGLGTSSTLINNIGQWLGIDAYELLRKSFGGSGYDIACAQHCTPIIYSLADEKPVVKNVNFDPIFKDHLYFVYLNRKQNSKQAVSDYVNKIVDLEKIIPKINEITEKIVRTQNILEFKSLLEKHELLLSSILEINTVKKSLFPDFSGVVKSLGAWGGDFVMVVSEDNPYEYFASKGFKTVIPYSKMIL